MRATLWATLTPPNNCFGFGLYRVLFSGESPLRIGCKVSVMVTQSAVVLDNVTRWKWVKEIGNHQYAPCVNWRRSWFMAPGYSIHTCWIYFFPLSPGSRTGKGAFLRSSSPFGSLWHFVMDSPMWGQVSGLYNELSAIYRQLHWICWPQTGERWSNMHWNATFHVLFFTSSSVTRRRLWVSSYSQTERGQLWVY